MSRGTVSLVARRLNAAQLGRILQLLRGDERGAAVGGPSQSRKQKLLGFLFLEQIKSDVQQPLRDAVPGEDAVSVCLTGSAHRDRTVLHCQFCGKRGHAHNFMRSKRFCSTSCARG